MLVERGFSIAAKLLKVISEPSAPGLIVGIGFSVEEMLSRGQVLTHV